MTAVKTLYYCFARLCIRVYSVVASKQESNHTRAYLNRCARGNSHMRPCANTCTCTRAYTLVHTRKHTCAFINTNTCTRARPTKEVQSCVPPFRPTLLALFSEFHTAHSWSASDFVRCNSLVTCRVRGWSHLCFWSCKFSGLGNRGSADRDKSVNCCRSSREPKRNRARCGK